jgi:hypothetical protein
MWHMPVRRVSQCLLIPGMCHTTSNIRHYSDAPQSIRKCHSIAPHIQVSLNVSLIVRWCHAVSANTTEYSVALRVSQAPYKEYCISWYFHVLQWVLVHPGITVCLMVSQHSTQALECVSWRLSTASRHYSVSPGFSAQHTGITVCLLVSQHSTQALQCVSWYISTAYRHNSVSPGISAQHTGITVCLLLYQHSTQALQCVSWYISTAYRHYSVSPGISAQHTGITVCLLLYQHSTQALQCVSCYISTAHRHYSVSPDISAQHTGLRSFITYQFLIKILKQERRKNYTFHSVHYEYNSIFFTINK